MLENNNDVMNRTDEMMVEQEEAGKRTYTVNEIQDILGISKVTAYNLVQKGEFKSVRLGTHIRISKKSFDAWLDEQI